MGPSGPPVSAGEPDGRRFLVVGAGVAGLSLAQALEDGGARCLTLADPTDEGGATGAAAGLVNPLAGRRWALPWQGREAFATARETFGPAWWPLTIVRLGDPADTARQLTRLAAAQAAGWDARPLPADFVPPRPWPDFDPSTAVAVTGGLVPLARWAAARREQRRQAGTHRDDACGPDDLQPVANGGVSTPWGPFSTVIVATGAALAADPRWAFIPWQRSAGARLDLVGPRHDETAPTALIGGSWLVPGTTAHAWELGATTIPLATGEAPPPPPDAATLATTLWAGLGTAPLPSLGLAGIHHGVRLALPDHRPVADRHPDWPALAILAGFGGRGTLHAPWAARQLAAHLLTGAPIDPGLRLGDRWR